MNPSPATTIDLHEQMCNDERRCTPATGCGCTLAWTQTDTSLCAIDGITTGEAALAAWTTVGAQGATWLGFWRGRAECGYADNLEAAAKAALAWWEDVDAER